MDCRGRMRKIGVGLVAAGVLLAAVPEARADRTKAIREAVDYVMKKFGKEVAEESAETLTAKVATLAGKHGDEAIEAFRKVGPRAFKYVEEAGEHGPEVVRIMARQGQEAVWIVSQPSSLKLFLKYGDDAADAMIKHKAIAETLIGKYEGPAAQALKVVDGQNARRLVMLEEGGDLVKIGRTPEVMGVVGKYGDRAADFVWRNKGALLVAASLTAFLSNPEPFINGTRELTQAPLQEIARRTDWTRVILVLAGVPLLLVLLRFGVPLLLRRRRRA